MGDLGKGKGDGHRFIKDVPVNPDNKFWDWVEHERAKLKPQDKAVFDKELDEALDQRVQKYADGAAQESMKATRTQKHYDDLAKEQTKLYQQMREQIIQDLLKKGTIRSRAEVDDYRHPNFQKNQIQFDAITKKMMEEQMKMIPPWNKSK